MQTSDALRQLQAILKLHQAGQSGEAEALCRQALLAQPDQPDLVHLLGILNAQAKRYPEANSYFAKALSIAPTRADFRGNFANALWEQGRLDDALEQCRVSLLHDNRRAEVHNTLGNVLLAQGEPEAASNSFREAVMLQPSYHLAHNNLGLALHVMGQHHEAAASYRTALEIYPDYPEGWNNRGLVLKELGHIEEATQCFRHALKLRPGYANAQASLAEMDPVWVSPLNGSTVGLRRWREEDADYLHACYRDAAFMNQYNHFIPREQSRNALERKLRTVQDAHPCQTRSVDWLIVRQDRHQPIGIAGLVEIQFAHRRAEFMIGFPNPQDRAARAGLEAGILVLDYAFNLVGLNKLTTFVYGDNEGSRKNTLAFGFMQESTLREHIAGDTGGEFLDLFGFGMTCSDFRSNLRLAHLSIRLLGRDVTVAPVRSQSMPSTGSHRNT